MAGQVHELAPIDGEDESRSGDASPMRRIDVSDLRLDSATRLALRHPAEYREVFFERRGARSFLVGRK